MKGLLFFRMESQYQPSDARIAEMVINDQKKHEAAYHIETIRICIGAEEDSLELGNEPVWRVRTHPMGAVLDREKHADLAYQLGTCLYSRIVANSDTGCSAVFVGNGETAANTAAVQMALLTSFRLSSLYPVKFHLLLLQDQYVYRDQAAGLMMRQITASNAYKPVFYTSQYLLPWEETGDVRENSRKTILALVRSMMMSNADPMMLPDAGKPMWVETAAVRRLGSPVEQITNVIYKYLTDDLADQVLVPAVEQENGATVPPKEMRDCVRYLEGYVNQIERNRLLPTLEDLMSIMPQRNPAPLKKFDDEMSADRAWDMIYQIYGREKGEQLRSMLNPSLEEMERQYEELGAALAREMLRQVMMLARTSGQEFSTLPHLIKQIGDSLINQRDRSMACEEDEDMVYAKGLILSRERKEAIALAKTRHYYLSTVYRTAQRRLSAKRKELKKQMMEDAIGRARLFIKNTVTRLYEKYSAMCSIYLNRPVEQNCYNDYLESAYGHWCSHGNSVERLTVRELYAQFTDEVFGANADEAASMVCRGLEQEIMQRLNDAVESIRVNIDSFFPELNFRASLLKKQGMDGDLNRSLLNYLNSQKIQSPLLYQEKAGSTIRIQAKALIFHSANAGQFVAMAENANITVVNDPHEKGVQLLVKFAGNALNDVLVYSGNVVS